MDEVHFTVQVSNDTPHCTVTIRRQKKNLSALCTCEHGGLDTLCKHRLSILAGKAQWVISDNTGEVKRVLSWVAATDVGEAMVKMVRTQKRLKETEKKLEESIKNQQEAEAESNKAREALIRAINNIGKGEQDALQGRQNETP